MKLSVSLADSDVAFLDEYAREAGLPSRSAAMQRAVAALRSSRLERDYEEAFTAWGSSPDAALWENTVGDADSG